MEPDRPLPTDNAEPPTQQKNNPPPESHVPPPYGSPGTSLANPMPSTAQHQLTPPPDTIPKKKHYVRHILGVLLACLVLLIGISVLYGQSRRVTVADLVMENTQNTSYLRPNQWKPVTSGNISGYGDQRGKDGKSTALVVFTKPSQNLSLSADNDDESYYTQIRKELMNEPSLETSMSQILEQIGTNCTNSNITSSKKIDTTSTPTTIGLFTVSATCDSGTQKTTIKTRGILGRDGYMRIIGVLAPEQDWKRNSEAFQKILDSLAQTQQ